METRTFDELISDPQFVNLADNGLEGDYYRWQVLLRDGSFYTGSNDDIGHRCLVGSERDQNAISWKYPR